GIRLGGFELLESPWRHGRFLVRQGQGNLVKRVLALVVGRAPRTPPNARKVRRRARRSPRACSRALCCSRAGRRAITLTEHATRKPERRQQREGRQPIAHSALLPTLLHFSELWEPPRAVFTRDGLQEGALI